MQNTCSRAGDDDNYVSIDHIGKLFRNNDIAKNEFRSACSLFDLSPKRVKTHELCTIKYFTVENTTDRVITLRNIKLEEDFNPSLNYSITQINNEKIIIESNNESLFLAILPKERIRFKVKFTPNELKEFYSAKGFVEVEATSASGKPQISRQQFIIETKINRSNGQNAAIEGNAHGIGLCAYDADPFVHDITSFAGYYELKGYRNQYLTPLTVYDKLKKENLRTGYTADGNTRLFLVARTDKKNIREATFYIENKWQGAKLEFITPEDNINIEDNLLTGVTVPVRYVKDDSGKTYSIAIVALKAGRLLQRLSSSSTITRPVKVTVCFDNDCSEEPESLTLTTSPSPIILIHGLWASPNSFKDKDEDKGLYGVLKSRGFKVKIVDYSKDSNFIDKIKYPDYKGPSELATPDKTYISKEINAACHEYRILKIACTRGDIVAHSMGGLMARAFITEGIYYKHPGNYHQGSVGKLITMGTPHLGSGLANFLKGNSECIGDENVVITYLRLKNLTRIRMLLLASGQIIGSAINDLQIGPKQYLSSHTAMTTPIDVPVLAIVGKIGTARALLIKDVELWGRSVNHLISNYLELLTGCTPHEIFNGIIGDGVVDIQSASWKGYITQKSSTSIMNSMKHTGMGKNPAMINRVSKAIIHRTRSESLFNKTYQSPN